MKNFLAIKSFSAKTSTKRATSETIRFLYSVIKIIKLEERKRVGIDLFFSITLYLFVIFYSLHYIETSGFGLVGLIVFYVVSISLFSLLRSLNNTGLNIDYKSNNVMVTAITTILILSMLQFGKNGYLFFQFISLLWLVYFNTKYSLYEDKNKIEFIQSTFMIVYFVSIFYKTSGMMIVGNSLIDRTILVFTCLLILVFTEVFEVKMTELVKYKKTNRTALYALMFYFVVWMAVWK